MIETLHIDWSDVKNRFLASVDRGERWGQAFQTTLQTLHRDPYAADDFAGGSGADTLRWVRDGYYAPEFAHAASVAPKVTKRRARWSEEDGDPDPGRLVGGFDDFYYARGERTARPGLKVHMDAFFSAGVKPKTVADYATWCAGIIGALERAGYDLDVDLRAPVEQLYEGGGRTDMLVKVKRSGELSHFGEWSAMFAPTGTRHLLFTAFGVASEQNGKQMTSFCAMSLQRSTFGVEYDGDTLRITAAQRSWGKDFPTDELNAAIMDTGLLS